MTMLLSLHQQPEQAADPGGFWRWLYSFCSEPGGIELLLTVALVGCVVFTWWRLTSLVKNSRAREALSDYLLGVEQALQGDLAGVTYWANPTRKKNRLERMEREHNATLRRRTISARAISSLPGSSIARSELLTASSPLAVTDASEEVPADPAGSSTPASTGMGPTCWTGAAGSAFWAGCPGNSQLRRRTGGRSIAANAAWGKRPCGLEPGR